MWYGPLTHTDTAYNTTDSVHHGRDYLGGVNEVDQIRRTVQRNTIATDNTLINNRPVRVEHLSVSDILKSLRHLYFKYLTKERLSVDLVL